MNYRNVIRILGFSSVALFVVVSAFFVVGTIERGIEAPPEVLKSVKVKSCAENLNLVRVVANGEKYVVKARRMEKLGDGITRLDHVRMWYYRSNGKRIYMMADKAFIYVDNNVKLMGHVVVRSGDVVIHAPSAFWNNKRKTLVVKGDVSGYSKKYRFRGVELVYDKKSDVLKAKDVDIWMW